MDQLQPPASVESTLKPVIEVRYNPGSEYANVPIQALTGQQLSERMPASHAGTLQRLRFHLLVVCSQGEGAHEIDFARHQIHCGKVLHIRPGQVHRFTDFGEVKTELLLWTEELQPERERWFPGSQIPTSFDASPTELAGLQRSIAEIRAEQRMHVESQVRVDLLQALLQVVLRRLDTLPGKYVEPTAFHPSYQRLHELLEERVLDRPSVASLAAEIGYSPRTLDRAALAATNQTAKQIVDDRIGLELRRLLADQSRPMSTVRAAFGFADASTFAKFARRHLGEPPGTFRSRSTKSFC